MEWPKLWPLGFPLFSFRVVGKIYFVHFHKTTLKKIALSYSLNCFDICKYFKHNKFLSFYEKESYNVTIIPSWDSADDVQYINVDVILNTLYTGWQTTFMYIFMYNCIQWTVSWKSVSRDVQNTRFLLKPSKEHSFFSIALPRGSCVNRKMGLPTSYFPVFFFFQGWKERERKREE
jgi:hypothetical protein